ncbi:MAG: PIN domain-containing protein [Rhodocyclaceae bacterium]|nr:PIN domain-containing protein [Rhodocyclaceae bacterium]
MYLVDTSVWIDYLRGRAGPHVDFLDSLLAHPLAVGLSEVIYLEILQGARDVEAFERLRRYFSSQRFYGFADSRQSYEAAARLFLDCRRQGITVRSTLDCLIAQCALENALVLLHNDRYYLALGQCAPALRQKHFLD